MKRTIDIVGVDPILFVGLNDNNIKVLDFNDSVTLRTLIFEISKNKVMSVQLENAP